MSALTYLVRIFIIIGFISRGYGTPPPHFQVKYHSYTDRWVEEIPPNNMGNTDFVNFNHLQKLSQEERIQLCNEAKKFVGGALEGTSPITYVPIKRFANTQTVFQCDTVPISYLMPRDIIGNRWDITINTNEMAKKHYLKVETVTTKPISCMERMQNDPLYLDMSDDGFDEFVRSTCFEDVVVKRSHLRGSLTSHQLIQLCLAARDEIQRLDEEPSHVPVFQNNQFGPPQRYHFQNTTRVAFQCPCVPVVYMYFIKPRANKEVQVVLFKDNEISV